MTFELEWIKLWKIVKISHQLTHWSFVSKYEKILIVVTYSNKVSNE